MRRTAKKRVGLYVGEIRRIYRVDSQAIRAKLLNQLNTLFKLAISIAKGKIKRLTDDQGKEYTATPQQRMKWARLAACTTEVMLNVSRGFDEKEFQTDLKRLEQMANEINGTEAEKNNRTIS